MEAKTVAGALNGGWVAVMLHACTAYAGRVSADCACLGEHQSHGAGDSDGQDEHDDSGGDGGGIIFAVGITKEPSALP